MVKARILMIDDDVVTSRALKMGLENTGHYEVRLENSGARGLAAAIQFVPDLILLDVMMPGMDGPGVASHLMESSNLGNIPIIFMSSLFSAEEADRTDTRVGYQCIAKPAPVEKVIHRIEEELAKQGRSTAVTPA